MLNPSQVEELIRIVSAMEAEDLTRKCLEFRGSFPVDFTEDYLRRLPIDRLRHIYLAMCIHCGRIPIEEYVTA